MLFIQTSFLVKQFPIFSSPEMNVRARTLDSSFAPFLYTRVYVRRYLWFWRKKMIPKERKGYEEGDRENVSNWMNIHVHPFFHLHTSVPWYSKLDINEYLCSEKVRIIRKEIERKKERKDEGEIWRIVSKLNEHPSTCTSSSTGE